MKKISFFFLATLCCIWQASFAQTFTSIDIFPGTGSADLYGLATYNGKVYSQAQDGVNGYELWSSDGTQAGTTLVKDINPGINNSSPFHYNEVNGKLLFVAQDGVHGGELWVTDGTTAGTNLLKDIYVGPGSSIASNFTLFNNKLYFSADDSVHGSELWVTDGTSAGTQMLKDINAGTSSSSIYGDGGPDYYHDLFTEYNGKLYFRADDGTHGVELWSTDGTSLGTAMVKDISSGPADANPTEINVLNGQLLMGANDGVNGTELWISDGTSAGTSLLKDINPGLPGSNPGNYCKYINYNGKLYFGAKTAAAGYELWVTDGTTLGTTMVKDILAGPGASVPGYYGFYTYQNKLFFNAYDSINGTQLWTSDGTDAGTTLFKVLATAPPFNSLPLSFINYNGQLIFQAAPNATDGPQLWTSDGTPAGTHIIAPAIAPNASPLAFNYTYASYAVANGKLFFDANFNNIGDELWVYELPATSIRETGGDHSISAYPNPFSAGITLQGLQSDESYAVQIVDMTGRECYRTDLTPPGTTASTSIPDLSAGVYMLSLTSNGNTQTFRMVKN